MLNEITPLILTYNEASNIDRTLQHLTWAEKIVVIDSFSTDETLEILHFYVQVQVFWKNLIPMQNNGTTGYSKLNLRGFFPLMQTTSSLMN